MSRYPAVAPDKLAEIRGRNNWLLQHSRNEASQSGEDGILEKIFSVLGVEKPGWSVEFGAWDGKHLSNTWHHVVNRGWTGVFIEGDPKRFKDLNKTFAGIDRVHGFCEFVQFEGRGALDEILSRTSIPKNFELLSIDVDGNDYHFWDSVKQYRPRVVVIEFNPAIPDEVDFVQARDMSLNQGNSIRAMVRLGKTKGYELVCLTDANAIFVQREDFAKFNIEDNSPEAMHDDSEYRMVLYQLYDGTLKLEGCRRLVWHKWPISAEGPQILPKPLRKYIGIKMGFFRRQFYKLYRSWYRSR